MPYDPSFNPVGTATLQRGAADVGLTQRIEGAIAANGYDRYPGNAATRCGIAHGPGHGRRGLLVGGSAFTVTVGGFVSRITTLDAVNPLLLVAVTV